MEPSSPSVECEWEWQGDRLVERTELLRDLHQLRKHKGWIYLLSFPQGMVYVGQTRKWERRMRGHARARDKDDGHRVKHAIRKYGWRNVRVSVLSSVQCASLAELKAALNAEERRFIGMHQSSDRRFGYNLTEGGDDAESWQQRRAECALAACDNGGAAGRCDCVLEC